MLRDRKKAEFTWFTYQDNIENQGRASEATFVQFLCQHNVLQNLAPVKNHADLFFAPYLHCLQRKEGRTIFVEGVVMNTIMNTTLTRLKQE